jgi:hypothetical protein
MYRTSTGDGNWSFYRIVIGINFEQNLQEKLPLSVSSSVFHRGISVTLSEKGVEQS